LFPFAVEAGIDAREYWLYTLLEITATLEGYKKRLAAKASLDYNLAALIGANVATLFDKKNKVPTLQQAYPNLFPEDKSRSLKITQDIAKQRLMKYAQAHNAKMRNGEK